MKLLLTILFTFILAFQVLAYDYQDDNIQLTILDNGNWELQLEGIMYWFEFYDLSNLSRVMKVTGEDDTCYWLYEKGEELLQSECDIKSLSIMFGSINP